MSIARSSVRHTIRPEDCGHIEKSYQKFMQWGTNIRFKLHGDALEAFREYMEIDATQIWGWGVGVINDKPAVKMGPDVPAKVSKKKLPFFINHIRKSTQWAKVRVQLQMRSKLI